MKVIETLNPPRGKGVTILIGNQIMFTQPIIKEDRQFMAIVVHWITEYQKGNPRG